VAVGQHGAKDLFQEGALAYNGLFHFIQNLPALLRHLFKG
jgi:hypothetical protein